MGVFKQFGQLLWKNFVLRKRQPHVLLLEIVWPIFIFLIVVLVRVGLPPSTRATCSYNPHAMPSAGMVPFLQSTVCNLDNTCESSNQIQEKQQNAAKLSALMSSVQPYLSEPKIIDALDTMDTGVQLVAALDNIAKNGTLSETLNKFNGSTLTVKNLLRDPTEVKRIIVDDLKILSSDVADALLDSEVNVVELFSNIDYIDFEGIACDPSRLGTYMLFRSYVNVTRVSMEVCAINTTQIPAITNVIQKQIDISAIVRAAKSLVVLTNDYTLTDGLEDIATMVDLIYGTSTFSGLIHNIPTLQQLPDLLHKFPQWVDTTLRMGKIDTEGVDSIINFVDPIIEQVSPNDQTWNATKSIAQGVIAVINSIGSGETMDWSAMLAQGMSLTQTLEENNVMDMTNMLGFRLPEEMISNLLISNYTGNISSVMRMEDLQQIRGMMEQFMGKNMTDSIMVLADDAITVATTTIKMTMGMNDALQQAVNTHDHVSDAIVILMKSGPHVMTSFMTKLTKPRNIMALMESSSNYMNICKETVQATYRTINQTHADTLETLICTDNVSAAVQKEIDRAKGYNVQNELQTLIYDFDAMMNGQSMNREVQTSTMYMNLENMMAAMDEMQKTKDGMVIAMEHILQRLSHTHSEQQMNELLEMISKMPKAYEPASWPVMFVAIGPIIENTTFWNVLGPWVRTADALVTHMVNQMKMTSMMTQNKDMEKLMMYAVDYAPELVSAAMDMMMNTTMMMELATTDISVTLCQNHLLQKMNLPSYVPVLEMESLICTMNITEMISGVMAAYDTTQLTNQIGVFFNTSSVVGTAKGYDWAGMVYMMDDMMDLMESTASQESWDFMQQINMSKIQEAMHVAMTKMSTMLSNSTSMLDTTFSMLSLVDTQMQNQTEWRAMKHGVKAFDAYVKFVTHMLTIQQDPNLTLDEYLSNISKTFANFMHQSTHSFPIMLEALKNVTANPSGIMRQMMTLDLSKLCNGTKIFSLLGSPELEAYEDLMCHINWTAVAMEMFRDDPNYQEYTYQLMLLSGDWAMLPDININWDEVAGNTLKFFDVYNKMLSGQMMPMFGGNLIDVELQKSINATLHEFLSSLSGDSLMDFNRLAVYYGELDVMRRWMINHTTGMILWGNMTVSDVLKFQYAVDYQMNAIIDFAVKQMQYFNRTHHVNLREYLNSSEIHKILDAIEDSSEINTVVMEMFLNIMFNPDKITTLITSWDKVCTDIDTFKTLLPADTTVDAAKVQSRICGVMINETKLISDLSQNLDGFAELIQNLMTPMDQLPAVDYGKVLRDSTILGELIAEFITNPPNITLGIGEKWMSAVDYSMQWDKFLQALNNSLMSANPDQITALTTGLQSLTDFLTKMMPADNSTDIWHQLAAIEAEITNQMYAVLQFANTQLEYFNSTDLVNMKTYFNSSEVNKIIDAIAITPEFNKVMLQTLLEVMFNPEKAMTIMNSMTQICTDVQVLRDILPANTTVDVSMIQSRLCGLTLNETKLMEELTQSVDGFAHLLQSLSGQLNTSVKVSQELITKETEHFIKLLTDLMMHPPNITLGVSDAWMMPSSYSADWEDFVKQLTDGLSAASLSQTLSMLQQPGIEAMFAGFSNTTEYKLIMQVMNIYLHMMKDQIQRSQAALSDPISLFDGYPEMQKAFALMDDIPMLYQAVVYTSFFDNSKLVNMISLLSQGWDGFCNYTGPLLAEVPGANYSADSFKDKLCALNLTKLMLESAQYQGTGPLMELLSVQNYTNFAFDNIGIADIVKQVMELSELMTEAYNNTAMNFTLPKFLQEQFWNDAVNQLNSILGDPQKLMEMITPGIYRVMDSLTPMLIEDPFFRFQLQMMDVMYSLFDELLDNMKNDSYIDIADFFGKAEEVKKMWALVQQPGVIETLVNSLNNPEFGKLLSMDAMGALTALCHPTSNNFSVYFSVPSYVTVDMAQLQTDFCAINLTTAMEELGMMFDLSDIMMKLSSNYTPSVNFTAYEQIYTSLSAKIEKWVANPPTITGIPATWMNGSYWANILMNLATSTQNPAAISSQIDNLLVQLQPLLSQEPFLSIGIILENLLNITNSNLNFNFGNLTLENMVQQIPALDNIFHSLNISSSTLQSLFASQIRNPAELLKLFTTSDPATLLCSPTSDFWEKVFVLNDTSVSSALSFGFCNLTNTDTLSGLFTSLKLEDIMALLTNGNTTQVPNWSRIIQQAMQLSTEIQKLMNQTANLDLEKYFEHLLATYANNSMDITNLLSLYAQLDEVLNIFPEWNSLDQFLRAGHIVFESVEKILAQLAANGGKVDLATLFQNSSTIRDLLQVANIDETQMQDLLSGYIKYDKYDEFIALMMNPDKLPEFLCDESQWRDIFSFPSTVNVTSLVNAICHVNSTQLMEELVSTLSLQNLVTFLTQNDTTSRFDIEGFLSTMQRVSDLFLGLMNASSVDWMNHDWQSFNMTQINDMLEMEMKKLQESFPAIFTSLEELVNSVLNGTTELREASAVFNAISMWTEMLTSQLTVISNKPANLTTLIMETDMAWFIQSLVADQQWMDDISDVHFNPHKLLQSIKSSVDASQLCQSIIGSLDTTTTSPAVTRLQVTLCSLNETYLEALQESVSKFLYQHIMEQQFQFLITEAINGRLTLNLTSATGDRLELAKMLTNIMNLNLTLSDLEYILNPESLGSLLQRLGEALQQQFGSQLADWSQFVIPTLSSMSDPMTTKAIQTLNVILNMANERLRFITHTVTIEGLLMNNTVLTEIIQAGLDLNKNGMSAVLNQEIQLDRVFALISNANLLISFCGNHSVTNYIKSPSGDSSVASSIAMILCINPDVFVQAINNQTGSEYFNNMLAEIWGSNTTQAVDWNDFDKNLKEFGELLGKLLESPPQLSFDLMSLLDMNSTIEALMNVFTDPSILMPIITSLNPMLNVPIPQELVGLMTMWEQTYPTVYDVLRVFNGSIDSSILLQHMSSMMTNLETTINPLMVSYHDIMIERAGQTPVIKAMVCNTTSLMKFYSAAMATKVSSLLCNTDSAMWVAISQQNEIAIDMLDYNFREHYQEVTGRSIFEVLGLTWSVYLSQMQDITTLFSSIDFSKINWDNIFTEEFNNLLMNQSLAMSLETLKMMDGNTKAMALGFMNLMVEMNKFMDTYVGIMKEHGSVIPFAALLPNNTLIRELLEQTLGHQTAAALLVSYIHPMKFWELSFSNNWPAVVCNYTVFTSTFDFPDDFNVDQIQKDLCNQTLQQQSAINEIFMKLDVGVLMNAFNSLMTSQNSTGISDEYLMSEMSRLTLNLIENIMYMENLNFSMDSINQWLEPIMQALYKIQNPDQESMVATCDGVMMYIKDSQLYKLHVKPTLDSVMNSLRASVQQMELQDALADIMCDLSTVNLTVITKKLVDSNITEYIQQMLSPGSQNQTEEFQCGSMATVVTELIQKWNETIMNAEQQHKKISQCMIFNQNFSLQLLVDAASTFNLAAEMLQILQDPALRELTTNPDLVPFLEFILTSYTQRQDVALRISELFVNATGYRDYLENTVQLAPDVISLIFNSTLNLEAAQVLNFTVEQIQHVLCNSTYLEDLIDMPQFAANNVSFIDVSAALCGANVMEIAQTLKDFVDLASVSVSLTTSWQPNNQDWWTRVATHITNIVDMIQQLELSSDLFSQIQMDNLEASLVPVLQRLIYDNGPEAIAESMVLLIEEFKYVDNSTFGRALLTDLQAMVRGLSSLKLIRNFMPANVLVSDVLKDPAMFRDYLMTDLSLSREVADAILSGTVEYNTLMEYSTKDIVQYVCNATELGKLLNVSSTKVTIADVSTALCHMNESNAILFADTLLLNADIGSMLEEYVTAGISDILSSLDVPKEEVKAAVKKLTAANVELRDAAVVFENKTKELELEVLLQPQALTGGDSMSSIQQVLCGQNTGSTQITDVTGVASTIPKEQEEYVLDAEEQAEMQELPGEFCQNLYKDIVKMDTGSIIWTYLKPLARGKIPYAPDTPVTRRIIEKMNATTFAVLADVTRIARSWSTGSDDIYQLIASDDKISNVESLLDNSLVDSFLRSTYDVTTQELVDGLNTLKSVDQNQITNMTHLAELIFNYSSCIEVDRFQGYATEKEVEEAAARLHHNNNFLAGIIFESVDTNKRKKRAVPSDVPKHITYTIRMDIENVKHTNRLKERFWRPYPEDDMFMKMRYFRGFIQLQDMLEQAIINIQTGLESNSTVYLQQFPSQCYKNDGYLNVLSAYLLPVMMTVAWLAAMAVASKNLVYDREFGQEEVLKTMGLNSVINWWAWFLSTMLLMAFSSLICCLILRFGNLFQYTNFGILFLYFIAFCFSSTMMCYMISSFFTRTTLAMLSVLIFYIISYLPYIVLISLETYMVAWQKTLACLLSTSAFGFAAQYLARYEIQMVGIQWSNIDISPIPDDEMNFSLICIILALDGVLYLLIGWYVRNVKPGKYGVSQPWYFPVLPSYWGCSQKKSSPFDRYKHTSDSALVEEMNEGWKAGISLRGLTKKFGNFKAVNSLNCDFYEGQITVLLGHNGAAKSTTLNMLTGILDPTSGSVQIYGKPANRSSEKIGVCPQHNALFAYMTVREHMEFYASIKSDLSKEKVKQDIKSLLKDVDLWHVRDTKVTNLSGGMQRRLSIALAFTGGSEAIILDEPTSGVDPSGRRAIWNLLNQRKTRCTILLSTHFLDEADMIGDRVAVMHNGRIMCAGSSFFLKHRLGSGYYMKFIKRENCDPSKVLIVIKSWLPEAEILDDIGSEVTISLPVPPGRSSELQKCLQDLDASAMDLGMGNYGIYDTTMDEVFRKVCAIADKNKSMTEEVVFEAQKNFKFGHDEDVPFRKDTKVSGGGNSDRRADPRLRVGILTQKFLQFQSLLIKRFHHYRRDWRSLISIVILPLLMFTAASGFMYITPPSDSAPARLLTPSLYGPNSYAFVKDEARTSFSQSLMTHLKSPPGMGPTCMQGMDYGSPFECVKADANFQAPTPGPSGEPKCVCDDYRHDCNEAARLQTVPTMVTNTTTILQDLSSKEIETYLLQTAETYKLDRYGGLSFNSSDEAGMVKSIVWFNNKGHHAMPSFYNALSNTVLRTLVADHGLGNPAEYGITAYNHPIFLNKQQLNDETFIQKAADLGIAFIMLVAFTFIPVGFVVYIVNEHKKKEKQLQSISGVGTLMYWFTSLFWDLLLYSITLGLTVAIMAGFQHNVYWARENLQGVVVLAILYGWALIPWMYSMVKCFRDATSAYMVLFCSSIFIGVTTSCCLFILEYFATEENIKNAYNVIQYILLVFPQFSFTHGFLELTRNQAETEILERFGEDVYKSPFSYDMLGWNYVALGITGFVFCVITLLLETSICTRDTVPSDLESDSYKHSEEVNNERQRILSNFGNSDEVVVKNLSKVFSRGNKKFLAVNHMCFGVSKGECFGLLGVNGAGKTTTFRMLTGDVKPSEGAAYIKGHRTAQGKANIGQEVGYCPQVDALDNYLSGREMLHCHARLRGLPADSRESTVEDLITRLNISYADKAVKTYSGGMKRMLSLAIALVGNPPVILLDEPTTGMDPAAKRLVWNALLMAVKNGQSVVMTSHSMEECDAICTRLGIMVNGEFKCLGSPQLLKEKYGEGYTVTLYTYGLSTNKYDILQFFQSHFPDVSCREHHQGIVQIHVPHGRSTVANILQLLEENKAKYNIQHYSVSQTTLDDVFLNFAREQNDGLSPEFYDSLSGSGSDSAGSNTHLSEPFTNPTYAYMNAGYTGESDDTKFGPKSSVFLNNEDLHTKL